MRLTSWILTIAYIISAVVALLIIGGFVRSIMLAQSPDQTLFIAGQLPNPRPDGLYSGQADGYHGSWQGKVFDAAKQSGINLFGTGAAQTRLYPFRTWTGPGLTDGDVNLLKIDYDVPGNPFWLRPCLDEVVDIGGGVLLGKLQFRLIPNYPFTVIFFRLKRA